MSTITIDKDTVAATLTVTARFAAPAERVWQVWSDPRQLERWWGPPTYPATVVDHDLSPGGTVTYFMTSPEGEKYHGWWTITASTPPHALSFVDGFADDAGNPNPDLPTTNTHVTLTDDVDGTTMVIESRFASPEAMAQLVAMGMEEGLTAALGQIDGLLVAA
jgi:uncharacterized protein YndB with AHSA1/START domain